MDEMMTSSIIQEKKDVESDLKSQVDPWYAFVI
jgi:hypothetical protein